MRIKVLLAKLLKTSPKLRNKIQWNLSYADAKKKTHEPKGSAHSEFGYYDLRAACFALNHGD